MRRKTLMAKGRKTLGVRPREQEPLNALRVLGRVDADALVGGPDDRDPRAHPERPELLELLRLLQCARRLGDVPLQESAAVGVDAEVTDI